MVWGEKAFAVRCEDRFLDVPASGEKGSDGGPHILAQKPFHVSIRMSRQVGMTRGMIHRPYCRQYRRTIEGLGFLRIRHRGTSLISDISPVGPYEASYKDTVALCLGT